MKVTDEQLRADIKDGLKPAQIAGKYNISRQSVGERLARLGTTTATVAAVAPVESRRYVQKNLDALDELGRNIRTARKLQASCEEFLQDADNPDAFNVGPRSSEIVVTYEEKIGDKFVTSKATLAELLLRLDEGGMKAMRTESKHADPRELVLKTLAETRQTIVAGVELAKLIADAQAMATLREEIVNAIGEVEPAVAERIARAVRHRLMLQRGTP